MSQPQSSLKQASLLLLFLFKDLPLKWEWQKEMRKRDRCRSKQKQMTRISLKKQHYLFPFHSSLLLHLVFFPVLRTLTFLKDPLVFLGVFLRASYLVHLPVGAISHQLNQVKDSRGILQCKGTTTQYQHLKDLVQEFLLYTFKKVKKKCYLIK